MSDTRDVVELTRVQPFEAQVIVAKLRASGIEASLSPDSSPYDSEQPGRHKLSLSNVIGSHRSREDLHRQPIGVQ